MNRCFDCHQLGLGDNIWAELIPYWNYRKTFQVWDRVQVLQSSSVGAATSESGESCTSNRASRANQWARARRGALRAEHPRKSKGHHQLGWNFVFCESGTKSSGAGVIGVSDINTAADWLHLHGKEVRWDKSESSDCRWRKFPTSPFFLCWARRGEKETRKIVKRSFAYIFFLKSAI